MNITSLILLTKYLVDKLKARYVPGRKRRLRKYTGHSPFKSRGMKRNSHVYLYFWTLRNN